MTTEKPAAALSRREWLRRYPAHCMWCEGHTDCANPCQLCLRRMLCPRCGRLQTDSGEDAIDREDATIPCRACGWVQDEPGAGCPPSRDMIRERRRQEAIDAERARFAEVRRLRDRLDELESRHVPPRRR
jgi:hypothetical protein